VDTETRSEVDLSDRGLDIYKNHPSTEVTCATVATDNFICTTSFIPSSDGRDALHAEMAALGLNAVAPEVVIAILRAATRLVASNAPFDQAVTSACLRVDIPKEKWSCTAARARRHGLPGSVENGAKVLGLPEGKDKEGNKLSRQLWKPRPTWTKWQRMSLAERANGKRKDGGEKWFEDAKKVARNCAYNAADVRVSREIDKRIPELEPEEYEIFLHVWKMNETGIPVDTDLIHGAVTMAEESRRNVTDRIRAYTGGMIQSLQAPGQLVAWAERYGYHAPSWTKDTVPEIIADPKCPEAVRVVAQARQEAGKGSVAKYETASECVSPNGRLHYQIEYAGTSTLRNAGRLWQPLNLFRPKLAADKSAGLAAIKAGRALTIPEWKIRYEPDRALAAIRSGDLALLRSMGDPEEILADHIRSTICAPVGKKIVSPDLSAIEARGVFWISDCESALAAYRRNEDLYCNVASQILGYLVNKTDHPEARQNYGKVPVLSCGYGAGVTTVALKNKIDEDTASKAVYGYRDLFPEVKRNGWTPLENAAIDAVRNPGHTFTACRDRVHFVFEGGWLRMRRPSGTWMYMPDAGVDYEGRLFYHFQHPRFGWTEESMWGGVLMNFVIQGAMRELMFAAEMQIARDSRYELVLQCYDSLTALVDEQEADALCQNMIRIMTTPPPWAPDFPLAAEGRPKDRYS
jgi:DNA polymerase